MFRTVPLSIIRSFSLHSEKLLSVHHPLSIIRSFSLYSEKLLSVHHQEFFTLQ